uniref:Aldehyde oxidase 1 n=1 Tax=Oncorhynchus kisutch TaxID=8019 RepID=A0A8C7FCI6_ONCKI
VRLTGTKYGCGGGGCGACTVMVSRYQPGTKTILHYSANACLLPVCQLQGAAVTTVEGIGNTRTRVHPVQERIAKAHGSQCGFCTPGMVMSMYTLLRNKPQPNMEDITVALGGNLCRCTGYRPIVDGCKTFSPESNCCQANGNGAGCCLNGDSPPERSENRYLYPDNPPLFSTQLMAEIEPQVSQLFRGERMVWVSPVSLEELIQLKTSHPQAPLVMGNTNIGPDIKFKGAWHPIIISPTRVQELFEVTKTPQGVCFGAGCSLSVVKALLEGLVQEIPEEKTEIYRSLLQQLGNLGGQQIRNVAVELSIVLSVFIPVSRQGEFMRAFRQAPRKENALATVTTGMRVMFTEGSSVVKELSIYYGGVGPCTVSATKTCAAVIGRKWDEQTLSEAYTQLLDEISLSPSHPGGQVEFRRSLTLSLLFKFNLQMLHKLWEMVWTGSLFALIGKGVSSAIRPLPKQLQPSLQEFQAVVKGQSGDDPVGRPIMHRSAISQATGEAVYCDDIPKMDGELHLVLVTSTRPHAKILDIDISEALRVPGVVDVITSKDIPGKNINYVHKCYFQVSCVGHMVCAVVADNRKQAKRGAALVKIAYEDLPGPVFTVEEAIEKQSFFLPQRMIERGNVDEAFDKVDHIYEGTVCVREIRLGGQEHFYMETQSMVVVPSGEERELKVYLSCQHPTYAQESIAETLGIPSNRVSCHVKRVGGAFGGKVTKTSIIACITSVAAWKTGRAVRCVLERGEDMLITGARHPVLGKHKVGFMNDGRIIAADLHYYANSGNTADESLLVIEKILLHLDNAYNVPNLRGRSVACKTNLPSNTAFRGFGVPQSMLVTENMINDVAMKLGCNQIREINMYKEVSLTHYKFEFDPKNLLRCWDECKEKSDYGSRRKSVAQFNQQNRWKKRGMATIPIKYGIAFSDGFLNQAASLVHIYKDGSVLVSHGGTEMGQGIHTKMQQVASRELHIPASLIHITETNTSAVPNTCPSAASFGTDANGMAVKDACEILYQRLEPVRKQNPEGTWQTWVTSAFIQRISLSATGYYRGHDLYMDWEKQEGQPYAYFTYGACCSEVEVDCLTGDYRTVRTDIVMDIGRSINPSVDIGQIEGAFIQGLGLYTLEELKFSPSGVLYTRGPSQYKIPAVCDIPLQFNVYLLSGSDNPHAIYSSKGIGEPVLFLGSSVFFAIKDAVAAARVEAGMVGPFTLNSPATPERTCLACNTPFTQKVRRCHQPVSIHSLPQPIMLDPNPSMFANLNMEFSYCFHLTDLQT